MWLQWGFDKLIILFEQVGINNNVSNMVGMMFQTWNISVRQFAAAYGQHMTDKGDPTA